MKNLFKLDIIFHTTVTALTLVCLLSNIEITNGGTAKDNLAKIRRERSR